jgi:nucleoside-diphosphate-sugar epimerase
MRVLVLGASGFIGRRIVAQLKASNWATPIAAARAPRANQVDGVEWVAADTLNVTQLSGLLQGVDAVVNSVAGNGEVIAQGAQKLVEATKSVGGRRVVHLSSMAVYGAQEGLLTAGSPLDSGLGWYARAKCQAEAHLTAYAAGGGSVVILRPGCVHGPGSEMWVGRPGRLLRSGRLGDIGVAGDGWSNLVHVDDVCAAVLAALRHQPAVAGGPAIFNVAAADSPRWNAYFADLAQSIGAVPLKHLSERRIQLDAKVLSPFLKIAEILSRKLGRQSSGLAEPLPPSLLTLWRQQIRMEVAPLKDTLGVRTMPYEQSLQESAAWLVGQGKS